MPQVTAPTVLYAYISGSWTLIDDIQPARAEWGIIGNNPVDRVADTGELTFYLNNSTGQYTPGGPSALAGWKKGIPVKLVVTYDGEDFIRFRGVISEIEPRPLSKDKRVRVVVLDWLDYAARHPIVNPGIQTDKRGDEVLTTVMNEIEVAPQAYSFDTGTETFPTVFDTTTSKTKAYNEFSKVAFSELGYVYLKKDKTNGETLVFEAADARHGWRTPDEIPLSSSASGFLLKEDGGYLLKEDGGRIILNQIAAPPTMDGTTIMDFDAPYGEHVINRMTGYAYPRKLDTSAQVLFTLSYPIVIGSGQTYILKGTWADPAGGLPINAQNVVTPVATTDYLANTASDGSGSNLTSDLTISTWTPGTEGFTAVLSNGGASTMYVTRFSPRGTGIYLYNPIEHAATDSASITEYEAETETIHQKYKNDLFSVSAWVESQVDEHHEPRIVLNSISFCANKSDDCMMSFLYTDVGDMRYIEIDELGIANNYYIQGVSFTFDGGLIMVKWNVKIALSLQAGLSPIAVEFAGSSGNAVSFGVLPMVLNLDQRSYSVWAYENPLGSGFLMGAFGGADGFCLYGGSYVEVESMLFSGYGVWHGPVSSLTSSTWHHIVVTFDISGGVTSDPIIYMDGVSVAVTEQITPSGTRLPEVSKFIVGNGVALLNAWQGKIFDPRVYNRILTPAEITEIYNSGTPDETVGTKDGLVFQAFAVRDENLADYVDEVLDSTMTVRDNALGFVGQIHGNPVGRAAP